MALEDKAWQVLFDPHEIEHAKQLALRVDPLITRCFRQFGCGDDIVIMYTVMITAFKPEELCIYTDPADTSGQIASILDYVADRGYPFPPTDRERILVYNKIKTAFAQVLDLLNVVKFMYLF